MRHCSLAAALVAGIGLALPAAAQRAKSAPDFLGLSAPQLSLPYPTESGKPIIYDPQFVAKGDSDRLAGCSPGLQCRLQLLGVVQNNGVVELRATAITW